MRISSPWPVVIKMAVPDRSPSGINGPHNEMFVCNKLSERSHLKRCNTPARTNLSLIKNNNENDLQYLFALVH